MLQNKKEYKKILKNPKKVHFLTQLLFHVLYVVVLYACMFFLGLVSPNQ